MPRHSYCLFALLLIVSQSAAAQSPITPDNPSSLQQGIDAAIHTNAKQITIPPGVYRLDATLQFSNLSDFKIIATGATLLRTQPTKQGLAFNHCRHVTLRGLTIQCETPPFTQGVIEAIDPAGAWIDLRVDAGYTAYFNRATTGYVFDPKTRQWKPGCNDYGITSGDDRGNNLYRLHLDHALRAGDRPMVVGDLMAFRGPGAQDIYLGGCADMSITNVTIRNGSGFCVHEGGGDGDNHYSYKLTYGPVPSGGTAPPLIASNADAFHSGGMRHGPTLENCSFEGMCDDGIPIHGYYAMVVRKGPVTTADLDIICEGNRNFFMAGDPLRLFDKHGALVGEAIVVTTDSTGEPYSGAEPDKHFKSARRVFHLKLDQPLVTEDGFRASDPHANGSGFVIRNCVIRNHRARGMLIKADDGLIENNTIDSSTICDLLIAPELYWNEACYSRNLIVRNNIFRHSGYATTGPWNAQAGTVTLEGEGSKMGVAEGHQHIVFENNTFEDNDGVNLVIDGAQDVLVKDNRFVRPQQQANRRGADRKIDPESLIWLSNCRDVRFEGNTVVEPGPYEKSLIGAGANAVDITVREGGVRAGRGEE